MQFWRADRALPKAASAESRISIAGVSSGRKTVVFHIGLEKTATTSLQRYCNEYRTSLLRCGLFYPRPLERGGNNHKVLAASYVLAQPPDRALVLRSFSRTQAVQAMRDQLEASDAEVVLISSEHMSSRFDTAEVTALAHDFRDYNVRILVAVRDHRARFLSSYSTYVLGGGHLPMPRYEARLLADDSRYMSVSETLRPWEEIFGREAIRVLDYDAEADIIIACLRECGLRHAPADSSSYKYARSLRPDILRTVQIINHAIMERQSVSVDGSNAAWLQLMFFSVRLRARVVRELSTRRAAPLDVSQEALQRLDRIAACDAAWLYDHYHVRVQGAGRQHETLAAPQKEEVDSERLAATLVHNIPFWMWTASEALVGLGHAVERRKSVR